MFINDGSGKGFQAKVDSSNRLQTRAVIVTSEHDSNHVDGEAYSAFFSQSPTAADDCIFYMANSSDDDIVVEGIALGVTNCTADDYLYIKIGDTGTRNSATAITPVNLNGGSGNTASGTFEQGADLDGGAATLTGGSEIYRYVLAGVTDLTTTCYNFAQDVILPKNKTITMWVGGSATGTYNISVDFHYGV